MRRADSSRRRGTVAAGRGSREASGRAAPQAEQLPSMADPSRAADASARRDVGRELAARLGTGAVGNAATAGALGDFFQYVIDHPVTLARQKSATAADRRQGHRGHAGLDLQRDASRPSTRSSGLRFKNTVRRAPEPGPDHRVRGERLRRRHPRAGRPAQRGAAALLRHRPGHRGRPQGRGRRTEDHQREGGAGASSPPSPR